jgi:hypothetical protein
MLLIDKLQELVKTYTILQTVASATNNADDLKRANDALLVLNQYRLALAVDAEMREIFWNQESVGATLKTLNFSQNDKAYIVKQGIAFLENGVTLSLINQGAKKKTITRNPVAWQQLFASVQSLALGQQTVFDMPEALRFGENQALQIGVENQTIAGFLFLAGCTLKDNLEEIAKRDIQSEFIDAQGNTKYLPETQLVPLRFIFTGGLGTFAVAPDGGEDIFSIKNDRSVLLTEVSTTATNCRIDKLTDLGRNQTLCTRIEAAGVASNHQNAFGTFYPLPFPHLLRAGDRLQVVMQNGSPMNGNALATQDVVQILCFRGVTL